MYYQGKVRPVYFQGKNTENPCCTCANNMFHAYGDEHQCHDCHGYEFYKRINIIDNIRIKFFNFLNRKGIHARPKKNWPFIEANR